MSNPSIADDVAERGTSIFESQIREQVKGFDPDAFLAIDVDSGDFAVAEDDWKAFDDLRARRPDSLVFLRRVGSDIAFFMGAENSG